MRKYKQAQKHGRTPSAATLALADWVLVATTLAADWTLTDVLRLYRARWQVELVLKRMKQLLRFNQLRSTHRTTVEATVRALEPDDLPRWPHPGGREVENPERAAPDVEDMPARLYPDPVEQPAGFFFEGLTLLQQALSLASKTACDVLC